MKTKVKTKEAILKSFVGWLPLIIFSAFFYGAVLFFIVMIFLKESFGMNEQLATQLSFLISGLLVLIGAYFYINGITKSLASYNLSIIDNNLFVKGKSGWKSIDYQHPLSKIKKVSLGEAHIIEKAAITIPNLGSLQVKDQAASRLTFTHEDGQKFKLDFATKAFDGESLYDFLVFIKSKGIETNVAV
ncbi:hypothetical protein [uncultured Methylophaga sp.]|uniref:hypothetical protein n=1 Tax=uncultured Methylophaga sp. TaxID=285271 RepID=UPI002631E074|nr:hypothetical protein [uncultured Methylophaga sp.]